MDPHTHDGQVRVRKFLILFLVWLTVLYMVTAKLVPDLYRYRIIDLTGHLVVMFSNALGVRACYGSGLATVAGFKMQVVFVCTSFQTLPILYAAVFAYPLHGLRYKVLGILAGTFLILFVNVIRIVMLGVLGSYDYAIFNFVHLYLWQGVFVVFILALFALWARGGILTERLTRFLTVVVIAALVSKFVMVMAMEHYLGFLAFVSNGIFGILNDSMYVSAAKDAVVYDYLGNDYTFTVSVDIYDMVIFLALMAASFKVSESVKWIKTILLGTAGLLALHFVFVISGAIVVIEEFGRGQVLEFLWVIRGISIASPILLWIYLDQIRGCRGLDEK